MSAIIKLLAGILTGSAGEKIGAAVSWATQAAAIAAAVAPVALWLSTNKDRTFIELTYGDVAFWGAILGVHVFLTIRLVHRAPPP